MIQKTVQLGLSTCRGLRLEHFSIAHPELALCTSTQLRDNQPPVRWSRRLRQFTAYLVECAAESAKAKQLGTDAHLPIWSGTDFRSLYGALVDANRSEKTWQRCLCSTDSSGRCPINQLLDFDLQAGRIWLNRRHFDLSDIRVFKANETGTMTEPVSDYELLFNWVERLKNPLASGVTRRPHSLDPDSPRPMTDSEFRTFLHEEKTAYGLLDYDNSFLRGWRKAFPDGCIGYYRNGRLVGGLGIWPVTDESAQSLVAGHYRNEAELTPAEHFHVDTGPCRFWYLGGLVKTRADVSGAHLFITTLRDGWMAAQQARVADEFTIIAYATSDVARRFLRHPSNRFTESVMEFLGESVSILFDGQFQIFYRRFTSKKEFSRWLDRLPNDL